MLKKWYFDKVLSSDNTIDDWRDAFKKVRALNREWVAESDCDLGSIPSDVRVMVRHSRVLAFDRDIIGHCIVSGNYLIAPYHYAPIINGKYVSIYQTWEHYENNHKEAELVELQLVKGYVKNDIAIFKFVKFQTVYKKCKNLFADHEDRAACCYVISGNNVYPLVKGVHFGLNKDEEIMYVSGKVTFKHEVNSGYITPLSRTGLCGSMLVSVTGDVKAMHVAGQAAVSTGFMARPSKEVRDDIRNIIMNDNECEFEVCTKIVPGISGVRLRYDAGEIAKKYPVGKTNFRPTAMHKDYNDDVANMCKIYNVDVKGPPVIGRPIDVLQEMSQKTFMHQGEITDDEAAHIESVMKDMIPEFEGIDLQTAIFGGDGYKALNDKSSNGYGEYHDKDDLFDFDNKCLKEAGEKLLNDFKDRCENDTLRISDTLCTEVFKDELRVSSKRTSPRTFRVMPVAHIVWTKAIFADMLKHFQKTMHKHGMCIGFNPYKDFDEVARRLKKCEVACDADFKKWDGSLNVRIMKIITDVFLCKYKGQLSKVLEKLMLSTFNSTVLVYDAVWRTTHGLPSGTWLTLMLNCLYNKCLTALTLYRNGCKDIGSVYRVVDYVTGDDKVCGASGKEAKAFNALTLRDTAASLGMECTNGDKTPITKPSRPFEDLDYLKRKFVYNKQLNRWVGALSLDTILNTIQWYDSKSDYEEAMEGKCRSMQIEAYLHGVSFFQGFTTAATRTFPSFSLFDEEDVLRILDDDDGYIIANRLAGKDISWLQE
jgi:hypothetical protein